MTGQPAGGVSRSVKSLLLWIGVLILASLAGTVDSARACSCVPPDPWGYLRQADGAVVGRLVDREEAGGGKAVLTFAVERAVKGEIGDTVKVRTEGSGAACGIEAPVGRRVGLFLRLEGKTWVGDLCHQVEPEDLLAAASPLPAPNGRGSVAMYVGGRFGPARVMALDARGRTLAYGSGSGIVGLMSPCPGGKRLAEIARLPAASELVIRDARTLRVMRRRALELPARRHPAALQCESVWGATVVVFGVGAGDSPRGARLYRLTRGRATVIWRGSASLSSLNPGVAYLNAGELGARLVRVDLRTGRVTRIAWLPRSPGLVPDPTGRRLAGVAYRLAERSRLVLVELGKAVAVRSVPLDAPEVIGDVHWLPDGRLLFLPSGGDSGRVLDRSLRTQARFRWSAGPGARIGSTVFGVDQRGRLVSAKLPAGPQRVVRRLPGRGRALVIVPAG